MKKSVCTLLLTLLCIALAALVALFGINALNIGGVLEEDTMSLGLDLVGGSSVTFKAIPEDGAELTPEDLNKAVDILRKRLDDGNYNEATVAIIGNDKIRVEIPGIDNPEEAVQFLGSTAKLTFEEYGGRAIGEVIGYSNEITVPDGTVVIEGKDVTSAVALFGPTGNSAINEWYVELTLNKDAQAAFAAATERVAAYETDANFIAIVMDGVAQSYPMVSEKIDSDKCVISGSFTEEGARNLAALISAGQLPVSFEEGELRSVGATLGTDALASSLKAGIIGIALVIIFMILVYRLPGFISGISLVAYAAIFAIVLSISQINLSLPGIAGIVLTIGMAVDSNVIIFERIKEELKNGKTLKSAVKAGFDRAFSAILDANVTTIIAAVVLWAFGTGSVQGFAKTLFVGVVISLFTALVITKVVLYSLVELKVNPKLFGSVKSDKE